MTFNLKEVKEEIKDTKELAPIVKFLQEFERGCFTLKACIIDNSEEFYIENAKNLIKLIKPEIKGLEIFEAYGYCEECGDSTDLFRLKGWEESEALCKECFVDWLIKNNKKVC